MSSASSRSPLFACLVAAIFATTTFATEPTPPQPSSNSGWHCGTMLRWGAVGAAGSVSAMLLALGINSLLPKPQPQPIGVAWQQPAQPSPGLLAHVPLPGPNGQFPNIGGFWPSSFPTADRKGDWHFLEGERLFLPTKPLAIADLVTLPTENFRFAPEQSLSTAAKITGGPLGQQALAPRLPRPPFTLKFLPARSSVELARVPAHRGDLLVYAPGATNADFLAAYWERLALKEMYGRELYLPPPAHHLFPDGQEGWFHPVGWADRLERALSVEEQLIRAHGRNDAATNMLLDDVVLARVQLIYSQKYQASRIRILARLLLLQRWGTKVDDTTREGWTSLATAAVNEHQRLLAVTGQMLEQARMGRPHSELNVARRQGLEKLIEAEELATHELSRWLRAGEFQAPLPDSLEK